jgi:outer membrane receptor protein involved in Fe transport
MRSAWLFSALLVPALLFAQSTGIVQGRVVERTEEGQLRPVVGASVYWLGSRVGTMVDTAGRFELAFQDGGGRLVISSVGFRPDTLTVAEPRVLRITLVSEATEVDAVNVVGQRAPSFIEYRATTNTVVMTEKELFKAACCNLSESFETNPSVDVSFTDAVTGTRQIEMLGLAGTYSQITLENIPAVRGLASNVGLTYIPGSWIENIQVSKGVGSVANGYESITGQINVEYRKPWNEAEQRVYLTMFGTDDQRFELNGNLRTPISEHLSSLTMVNMDTRRVSMDRNGDRFLDAPIGTAAHVLQRFSLHDFEGVEGQMIVQYTSDEKRNGTMHGIDLDHLALGADPLQYRYRMRGSQLRISGKTGYVFEGEGRSIGLQWSTADHRTSTSLQHREYSGRERTGYLNLLYDAEIEPGVHRVRGGLSLLVDDYDERVFGSDHARIERVPGAFVEYTYSHGEDLSVVAGLRGDRHNLFGSFITPRLHVRYAPDINWTLRLSAGRGQRTANIYAENIALFASSRVPALAGTAPGVAYQRETGWNIGLSATRYVTVNGREGAFTIDLHRTTFDDQLVVNLDRDARMVVFQPLTGSSFSNSAQAELNIQPLERFEVRTAYRFLDVRQTIDGQLRGRPYVAKHRAFVNLAYTTQPDDDGSGRMAYDLTVSWFGPKRLPETSASPLPYRRPSSSPSYFLVNGQVTRTLLLNLDLYVGVENLLDFRQGDPIISAADPSSPYFDSSIIWGPVQGRMMYGGVRWRM